MDDRLTPWTAGQSQSRREKRLWDDRVEGSARGGVVVPPEAHSSSSMETLEPVSEQEGLPPMPKDRGAKQGHVDDLLECRQALGLMAAETRGSITARQAAGSLPWIGVNDSAEVQRLQADHVARLQESANFQLGGPEKLTGAHDSQHAHRRPVLLFLQDFCVANARVGAGRSPLKTEVIHHVHDLDAAPPEWRVGDVRSLAKTSVVTDDGITLGITDQLLIKADVIRAMHEPVLRESLELAVSTTSCGVTATQSWRNKVLLRSTTRSGRGLSNGSSQVSRRTA